MDKAVLYFREQQYDKALRIIADSVEYIKYVLEAIIEDRDYFNLVATDSVLKMLSGILEAQKNKDYILLADLLELQLINFLCSVQELIISKEEILFDEEKYTENINFLIPSDSPMRQHFTEPINPVKLLESGYRVEFTSCGLMTLAAENASQTFYFHTNNRIQAEAFFLARNWYNESTQRYLIYGFGMGYHVKELQELAKNAEIVVYEADPNVIQLACAFTKVKELLDQKNITFVFDPEFLKLKEQMKNIKSEDNFVIHYPSYKNVRDRNVKELLEEYIPWSIVIEAC